MTGTTNGNLNKSGSLRKIQPAQASSSRVVKIPDFGTEFSISAVEKNGLLKTVPIVPGNKPNKFLALFESDDVDFEIAVDNRKCWRRHVKSTLDIHKRRNAFGAFRSTSSRIKTLQTNGRKLHFLRSSSQEGETFVATFAAKHGLSFRKASHVLSQIKFEVGYSKPSHNDAMLIVVNDFAEKFRLEVVPTLTVSKLKKKIEEFRGIKVTDQRLVLKERVLIDQNTLNDYGIRDGNEIHLVGRLQGGRGLQLVDISSEDEDPSDNYPDSDSTVVLPPRGKSNLGERGVIVLGDKSDQQFLPFQFPEDLMLGVSQFVIELRKKTQFGFNE